MKPFIPDSKQHAESILRTCMELNPRPQYTNMATLVKLWHCIAYLYRGHHSDEIDNPNGGWPDDFLPYTNEIRNRHQQGEINDDELYPADAQWAGLCDQLERLTPAEVNKRNALRETMKHEPLNAHILDQIDTREAMGRISVFFSYRDAEGPYEQWCGEWFETWEDAENYRTQWALELYENSARLRR